MVNGFKSQPLTVPQVILKQGSNIRNSKADDKADFKIFVNLDKDWNLIPKKSKIKSKKLDLEMYIAHELTHGLGFQSVLSLYQNAYSKAYYSATFMAEMPTIKGYRMLPISVYDSLIYEVSGDEMINESNSIARLGKVFEDTIEPNIPKEEYSKKFESNGAFMTAVMKLYEMAVSKKLVIAIDDGLTVKIDEFGKFSKQTTPIDHLADQFYNGPDFLMTRDLKAGDTLNSMMQKYNSTSIYGHNTIRILEMMGYKTDVNTWPVEYVDVKTDFKSIFFVDVPWN